MTPSKLIALLVALALIARVRVAILPGWVVPLPVLLVAAEFALCAAVVAWTAMATQARAATLAPPDGSGEVA